MITDAELMMYGAIGLGVALVMAVLATIIQLRIYKPIRRFKHWLWQRALDRHLLGVEEAAYAEDQARTDLMLLEMEMNTPAPRPYNYRHNIHCTCGKFAKQVVLGGVILENTVECHEHGVVVRWKDVPIDWATIAVAQVENTPIAISHTEPITIIPAMLELEEELEEVRDFTGQIEIQVIDDRRALSML